jgi:putative sterol carrier protein
MKPVTIKTDGGGSVEIRVNAAGDIFIRHSQMNPETWAELGEHQQKELAGIDIIPKRGGFIVFDQHVFDLTSREVNMIREAVKQHAGMVPRLSDDEMATQSEIQQSNAKIDREATNQLLHAYLTLQNQTDGWVKVLEQEMKHHEAVMTPAQKEATRLAIHESKCLLDKLQLLQGGVLK